MPQRPRRPRINWPYRITWLVIVLALLAYLGIKILAASQTFADRKLGPDWGLAAVSALLDTTVAVWFIAFGACIGSFLNVVAYRLPLGRGIGGSSSCPYCRTPIDSTDNVPILGWIGVRGRCRECRLPISIQYPLVEFLVAAVFFFVYLTEFVSGGRNLPGEQFGAVRSDLLHIMVTSTTMLRVVAYLLAVCGLIAAALIATKRRRVPLSLYAWSLLPTVLFAILDPELLPVSWNPTFVDFTPRLQSIATLLCGTVAGLGAGRAVAHIVYPGFDPSLLASDSATRGCRQFLGAMATVGCVLGWQASVAAATAACLFGILAMITLRRRFPVELGDLTVWLWLGLIITRAAWSTLVRLGVVSAEVPTIGWAIAGALVFVASAFLFRLVRNTIAEPENTPEAGTFPGGVSDNSPDDDSDELDEDAEAGLQQEVAQVEESGEDDRSEQTPVDQARDNSLGDPKLDERKLDERN